LFRQQGGFPQVLPSQIVDQAISRAGITALAPEQRLSAQRILRDFAKKHADQINVSINSVSHPRLKADLSKTPLLTSRPRSDANRVTFHFHHSYASRGVQALATGRTKAYRKRANAPGVAVHYARYIERHSATIDAGDGQHIVVTNIDSEAQKRQIFWERVERYTREGGRTQYRIIAELPHELGAAQYVEILKAFGRIFEERGLPYTATVHKPSDKGDARNFHAHIAYHNRPARPLDNGHWDFELAGTRQKVLEETRSLRWLKTMREAWAGACNQVLKRYLGFEKYDHRTYKAMGIAKQPTRHLSPASYAVERTGANSHWGFLVTDREFDYRKKLANDAAVQRVAALGARTLADLKAIVGDSHRPLHVRALAGRAAELHTDLAQTIAYAEAMPLLDARLLARARERQAWIVAAQQRADWIADADIRTNMAAELAKAEGAITAGTARIQEISGRAPVPLADLEKQIAELVALDAALTSALADNRTAAIDTPVAAETSDAALKAARDVLQGNQPRIITAGDHLRDRPSPRVVTGGIAPGNLPGPQIISRGTRVQDAPSPKIVSQGTRIDDAAIKAARAVLDGNTPKVLSTGTSVNEAAGPRVISDGTRVADMPEPTVLAEGTRIDTGSMSPAASESVPPAIGPTPTPAPATNPVLPAAGITKPAAPALAQPLAATPAPALTDEELRFETARRIIEQGEKRTRSDRGVKLRDLRSLIPNIEQLIARTPLRRAKATTPKVARPAATSAPKHATPSQPVVAPVSKEAMDRAADWIIERSRKLVDGVVSRSERLAPFRAVIRSAVDLYKSRRAAAAADAARKTKATTAQSAPAAVPKTTSGPTNQGAKPLTPEQLASMSNPNGRKGRR
jgi:hypothetical protein